MASKPHYGPDNPHPLSTMKTELVWEGKLRLPRKPEGGGYRRGRHAHAEDRDRG